MKIYIGYADLDKAVFEVHSYEVEKETDKKYFFKKELLPYLTPLDTYKFIPKHWLKYANNANYTGMSLNQNRTQLLFFSTDNDEILNIIAYQREVVAEQVRYKWTQQHRLNYIEHD